MLKGYKWWYMHINSLKKEKKSITVQIPEYVVQFWILLPVVNKSVYER